MPSKGSVVCKCYAYLMGWFLFVWGFVLVVWFDWVFGFRATPAAYGGSQARGPIRATAASLHHSHSNTGSKPCVCDLQHCSWQRWFPDPLSKARGQTCILMDTSQICFCCAARGSPWRAVFCLFVCFLFFCHFFFFFFLTFLFLGPLLRHMEVPRLGVESELQPPAYTRATATQDPSHVCNLHHSSRQRQILNPLSKARDRTRNLMVPSRIR